MYKKIFFAVFLALCSAGCKLQPQPLKQPPTTTKTQAVPSLPTPASTTRDFLLPLHTVGQVSRHSQNFITQRVRMQGYLLKKENGYIIISDEPTGTIGRYDLPVSGPGINSLLPNHKYELQGLFLNSGLLASNSNPDHLELEISPKLIK